MSEEEIFKLIGNIKRFDKKENGVDYYAGWDNALDVVIMDFKNYFTEVKNV